MRESAVPGRPGVSGWFGKNADGDQITRDRTCECGRTYTQRQLSARFMSMAERHGEGAVRALLRSCPDLYVPVLCPPCESRELGRIAPIYPSSTWAVHVPRIQDRERFARNMTQLCSAWNKPTDDETVAIYWRALERAISDDEFERAVLAAVRTERKWPVPAVLAQHARSGGAA